MNVYLSSPSAGTSICLRAVSFSMSKDIPEVITPMRAFLFSLALSRSKGASLSFLYLYGYFKEAFLRFPLTL